MKSFKFNLSARVSIAASGEAGEVIACAEYAAAENSYLVRYKAADGRAVEAWWGENALTEYARAVSGPTLGVESGKVARMGSDLPDG
ncbi:hypothetical protein [Paraburkholderia caballeronis]|uniref:hypothetical protein n=1 Tax=Paraburkholderia caballeronis TaxID=416943 RepID=UPI0010662A82|nr:hypothetical protein [Paraburkholderia caballeronis]TDV04674.1 hypothetical protein C7408_13136 [Paraburkholderia caballeronis]TDV07917.1 hypothetical protein C7406_13336 [Paraburkholderia caballeronis]TDV18208.1 hypothetical protein C7404_13136 [Paraburkholderia caballeronis]